MTMMEKKDVIKKLKNLLDELEAEEDPEEKTMEITLPKPPHPRWKLEFKQKYYVISTSGHPIETYWAGCLDDLNEYAIGNLFIDKQAAEFAIERLKVLAEMREWAGKWDDEFTIRYDNDHGIETYFHVFPFKSYGEMRFATKEDAINCINAVGEDRIKKYYFMIPEEANND